jgi:hypothetical protein
VRADLTLYATRHLMADWFDNSTIAKRTRDRIQAHVTDVPGGYGRKGSINANQMAAISALERNSSNGCAQFVWPPRIGLRGPQPVYPQLRKYGTMIT